MAETVKAWQCIGCGRIEVPQDCVGVCQYARVDLVYAFEHEDELSRERSRAKALETIVRALAWSTPRDGEWERSYRTLQEQARRALAEPGREREAA